MLEYMTGEYQSYPASTRRAHVQSHTGNLTSSGGNSQIHPGVFVLPVETKFKRKRKRSDSVL